MEVGLCVSFLLQIITNLVIFKQPLISRFSKSEVPVQFDSAEPSANGLAGLKSRCQPGHILSGRLRDKPVPKFIQVVGQIQFSTAVGVKLPLLLQAAHIPSPTFHAASHQRG